MVLKSRVHGLIISIKSSMVVAIHFVLHPQQHLIITHILSSVPMKTHCLPSVAAAPSVPTSLLPNYGERKESHFVVIMSGKENKPSSGFEEEADTDNAGRQVTIIPTCSLSFKLQLKRNQGEDDVNEESQENKIYKHNQVDL